MEPRRRRSGQHDRHRVSRRMVTLLAGLDPQPCRSRGPGTGNLLSDVFMAYCWPAACAFRPTSSISLWISAPPPPSRHAVSSRRICLVLNPRIAAAEVSVCHVVFPRSVDRQSRHWRNRRRIRQTLIGGTRIQAQDLRLIWLEGTHGILLCQIEARDLRYKYGSV
jgi:hypothetical protein